MWLAHAPMLSKVPSKVLRSKVLLATVLLAKVLLSKASAPAPSTSAHVLRPP